MTVLFAAGEAADLNLVNPADISALSAGSASNDPAYYEVGVSRTSIRKGLPGKVYCAMEAAAGECWFHFYVHKYTLIDFFNGTMISLHDASNNFITGLSTNTSGQFLLSSPFHADYLDIESGVAFDGVYDIHLKMDASAGFIRYYRDKFLVYQFKGDTRGALGDAARVAIDKTGDLILAVSRNNAFSQIVVSTTSTLNCKLYTVAPFAQGSDTGWVNGYSDVDDILINDATSFSTDTVGTLESASMSLPPSLLTNSTVAALKINYRTFRGAGATVNNIQPYVKLSSVNYNTGSPLALGEDVYLNQQLFSSVNPVTSLPWTLSDLDACEIGVEATA